METKCSESNSVVSCDSQGQRSNFKQPRLRSQFEFPRPNTRGHQIRIRFWICKPAIETPPFCGLCVSSPLENWRKIRLKGADFIAFLLADFFEGNVLVCFSRIRSKWKTILLPQREITWSFVHQVDIYYSLFSVQDLVND